MTQYELHAYTKSGRQALVKHTGEGVFLYEFSGYGAQDILLYTRIDPSQSVGTLQEWQKVSPPCLFPYARELQPFIQDCLITPNLQEPA